MQTKTESLRDDCNLFAGIYIACQTHEGDLKKFFQYENQCNPPSLSKMNNCDLAKKWHREVPYWSQPKKHINIWNSSCNIMGIGWTSNYPHATATAKFNFSKLCRFDICVLCGFLSNQSGSSGCLLGNLCFKIAWSRRLVKIVEKEQGDVLNPLLRWSIPIYMHKDSFSSTYFDQLVGKLKLTLWCILCFCFYHFPTGATQLGELLEGHRK